jgi:hypothetical protein
LADPASTLYALGFILTWDHGANPESHPPILLRSLLV